MLLNNKKNDFAHILILLIGLVAFIPDLHAQNTHAGSLELLSGVRFRITPLHVNAGHTPSYINQNPVVLKEDAHLSGLSLCVGLNFFLTKNIFLNYEGYIRNDEFLSSTYPTSKTINNKKLMLDHQFSLQDRFMQTKKLSVSSGIGVSFNNQNTKYSFSRSVYNTQLNKYETTTGVSDYKFMTLDLPIDLKFQNNIELALKTSYAFKHKFFMKDQLLLFSLTALYNFKLNNH